MQWLNGRYARRFNRRHKRKGHLFQGRFHSVLVEKETHLLELTRYVVLNPVRAGMVERPEEYRWSSYRATAGLEAAPEWLATEWILRQFGSDPGRARAEYAGFVDAGVGIERSPWDDLVGQIYLGTAGWIERMQALVDEEPRSEEHPRAQRDIARPTMQRVVEAVAKTFESTADAVCSRAQPSARMLAAWLGWNEGLLRLREIRAAFRLRSCGTISDLIRRCAREVERDPRLRMAARAVARSSPALRPRWKPCLPRPQTGTCVPVRPVGSGGSLSRSRGRIDSKPGSRPFLVLPRPKIDLIRSLVAPQASGIGPGSVPESHIDRVTSSIFGSQSKFEDVTPSEGREGAR